MVLNIIYKLSILFTYYLFTIFNMYFSDKHKKKHICHIFIIYTCLYIITHQLIHKLINTINGRYIRSFVNLKINSIFE